MDNEATAWIMSAKKDLAVANHLFTTFHPKPLEIVCYHCQQAAEKAVKAVIISNDLPGGVPKKHDISFLLGQLRNTIQIPEDYYDYADTLTPYGVAARYPNELFLEDHHAATAIENARAIIAWAEQNLQ